MENVRDWIKTAVVTLAFLASTGLFFYNTCATKTEIRTQSKLIEKELEIINTKLDNQSKIYEGQYESIKKTSDFQYQEIRKNLERIEAKVDRNNQNHIEHLKIHIKD